MTLPTSVAFPLYEGLILLASDWIICSFYLWFRPSRGLDGVHLYCEALLCERFPLVSLAQINNVGQFGGFEFLKVSPEFIVLTADVEQLGDQSVVQGCLDRG